MIRRAAPGRGHTGAGIDTATRRAAGRHAHLGVQVAGMEMENLIDLQAFFPKEITINLRGRDLL